MGHESTFHSINEQQLHESLNDLGLGGAVFDNSLDLTIGNTTENFRSFLVTSPRVIDQSFEPHGADDKQVVFSDEVQQNLKLDEKQLSITKLQR